MPLCMQLFPLVNVGACDFSIKHKICQVVSHSYEQATPRHSGIMDKKGDHVSLVYKVSKPCIYVWNSMISAHVKRGEGEKALKSYHKMQKEGVEPDVVTFLGLLKACSSIGCIRQGRVIHGHVIEVELESDISIGTTLIDMYSKCRCLTEANNLFDKLTNRNMVSWGAMIAGCVRNGHGVRALELFDEMLQEGIIPNEAILLAALKACGSIRALERSRLIHDQLVKSGWTSGVVIGNTLVDVYTKCGVLDEAHKVFDALPNRDAVSWSVLISGYTQHGHNFHALELFERMREESVMPEKVTFLGIMKAYGSIGALRHGKLLHDCMVRSGLTSDVVVGNSLIDMYTKCGSLEDAEKVFTKLPSRDVVSWTALMLGLSHKGHHFAAVKLFEQMLQEGIEPNKVTFSCIVKACGKDSCLEHCRVIHELVIRSGLQSDVAIGNALIDTYANCGDLHDARKVFDGMPNRSLVSWSAMISTYVQHDHALLALDLVQEMQRYSIKPDKVLFLCILQACTSIRAIQQGWLIHDRIIKTGLNFDTMVCNTLITMYFKCGSLKEACKVFDGLQSRDSLSWDAIIAAYCQHELGFTALELFWKMQEESIKPEESTFFSILKSCGSLGALAHGRVIHDHIIRCGYESKVAIGSTLIDTYAKCGSLNEAHMMFDMACDNDVVSWGAIITGYAQHGHAFDALEFFEKMLQEGIKPSKVVYTSTLKACGLVGAIGHGRLIHEQVLKSGFEFDSLLGNSLIDMYAKCGSLEEARKVFDAWQYRDGVSWCVMIGGYARHADSAMALQCFKEVKHHHMKLDVMMLANMLAACSHAGRPEEGHGYFKSISGHFSTSSVEHYGCLIDLLSRVGYFYVAKDLLQTMPSLPDNILWTSLLSGCRTHGNLEMGRQCFDHAVDGDPSNASAYVLMTNIYADTNMCKGFDGIKEPRKCASVVKRPGKAWTEVNKMVHEFIIGRKTHMQSGEIPTKIGRGYRLLKLFGYVPHSGLVLLDPWSSVNSEGLLFERCNLRMYSTSNPFIKATQRLLCYCCHGDFMPFLIWT